MTTTAIDKSTSEQPRSLLRRLYLSRIVRIVLLIAIIGLIGGYFYVQSIAKQKFQQQLAASFSGPIRIGSAQLNSNGAVAKNIKLYADQKSTNPFATIDSLTANANLSDLIKGNTPDSILVSGLHLNLDLEEDGSLRSLPLIASDNAMVLPAPKVTIENAELIVSQPGKKEMRVTDLNLTLEQIEDSIKVDSTANYSDATWKLAGDYSSEEMNLRLHSPAWRLNSTNLIDTPGIPTAVVQPLIFDGMTQVNIHMTQSVSKPLDIQADLIPTELRFGVPKFDLDFVIHTAKVHFDNLVMHVTEAQATVGGGSVHASGTTRFQLPEVVGDFQANLDQVDLSSIHTLASIPKTATGKIKATGSGNYTVNQSSGFHLDLRSEGDVTEVSYQNIDLEPTHVVVEVAGLELKKQSYEFQSLAGQVVIDTFAKGLDIHQFFTNFGLLDQSNTHLADQFGGQTDADIDLIIPLESAGILRSWQLTATTHGGVVDLASEQLKNIKSTVRFVDGNVAVERLVGIGPHEQNWPSVPAETTGADVLDEDDAAHRVYVSGKWPLPAQDESVDINGAVNSSETDSQVQQAEDEQPTQSATFEIEGTEVSVQWLLSIAKDYNVDTAEILKQFLPSSENDLNALGGHLTVNAKLKIPTRSASDFAAWDVAVDIVSGDIRFADQSITGLSGKFELANRVVSIKNIKGQLPDSELISVNANVPLDSQKPATVEATLPAVPSRWIVAIGRRLSPEFNSVADQLGFGSKPPIDGLVAMDLNLKRSAATEDQTQNWNAEVKFQSSQLSIKDKPVQNLDGEVLVDRSQVRIPKLDVNFSDGSSIKTKGQWPLEGKSPNTSTGQLEIESFELPLKWILDLVPDAENRLGSFDRQIQDSMATGRLSNANFWANKDTFESDETSDGNAPLLGFGQYVTASKLSGILTITSIENKQIQIEGELAADPLKIRFGRSNLESEPINLLLSADVDLVRFIDSIVSLTIESVNGRWNEQEIKNVTAEAKIANQQLAIDANAEFLEGTLKVTGTVPISDNATDSKTRKLNLELESIQLRPLLSAFIAQPVDYLTASLNSKIDIEFVGDQITVNNATLAARDFAWHQRRLSELFALDFSIAENILTVSRFHGDIAGGEASGKIRVALNSGAVGDYELYLRRTNLRIIGESIRNEFPYLESISGFANARLRGKLGRNIDGGGSIGLADAEVWGMGIKSLKLPIRIQLDPMNLAGKIEFRQSRFRAFDGAIRGTGKIEFGRRLDIDVDAELNRISTDQLLGSFAGNQNLGQGEIFGSLKLSGKSVQSLRDLVGEFVGRIEHSRSFQVPLLRNLAVFLNSGQLTQKEFDSDDVILRLANGRLNVERLTFISDAAQLFITGAVSTDGRLDLDVAARIANLSGSRQLYERFSGSPVAALANPTGAAVTRVTEFLSNRIVYVHLGGTASNPNFRLETGRLIRDQLVQQFFSSADRQFVSNLQNVR